MGRGMERDTKGGQVMEAAGSYFGHIVEMGAGNTPNTGTPYLFATWEITHVAENGDWRELPESFRRDSTWWLTDKRWPQTQKVLEIVGFNGDFKAPAASGDAVDSGMELECRHEDYNGKTHERWDLPYGGGGSHTPPPDDVLRRWGAKWKAERKPGGRPSTPPPAKPKPGTQITDDDIGPVIGEGQSAPNDDDIPFDPES